MLAPELTNNPFLAPNDGRCIINQLPSELLSHIFTLGWAPERDEEDEEEDFEDLDEGASDQGSCSSSSSASEDDDEAKSRKLPFNVLVSHICERWRAVALSNPLLWNHVSFVGPPPYDRALIYLARAGTAPLALTIDRTVSDDDEEDWSESDYNVNEDEDSGRDNDPDLTIITGIMNTVVPHINHTKALQIMVSFYPHIHRALEILGACPGAPMLEVLQLYHYEDTDEHLSFKMPELRTQSFKLFGGDIPKLTEVALWGVHVDWSKEGSPYLTGLTDLELAYHARDVRPSFQDFARILRASPGLRTLTLCLSCPAGTPADWPDGLPADGAPDLDGHGDANANGAPTAPDMDPTAPLVLPALKELLLAYLEPAYLLSLLPRLSLPALSSLALDLEDDDYSDRARSLLANLQALKLASLPCADALVADAYRQLENVVALNLNMLYLGDAWFDLLLSAPDRADRGETLLPRLTELTTTGVDGARMRELVEARAGAGVPLRKLLMNEDDAVDEEDEAWLAAHLERFELFEGSDEEEVDLGSADGDPWTDEDEDGDGDGDENEDGDEDGDEDEEEWEDADDDDDDESLDGGLDIVIVPL
ncbi:hypothetical protein C8Q80DRAFT_1334590 [Daedaleopsis nitida]|nr:hypothetical protein C8Q80DRAFT_1334590 [Daedaleopsis nitida]